MTKKKKGADAQPAALAYKGFGPDWKCRGFQYAVGESYEHKGKVKACEGGFHACEYPLDVLAYYPAAGSKFALVEQAGDFAREEDGDTKVASSRISIKAEIDFAGLIRAAIEYTLARVNPAVGISNSGDSGAASNSGDSGAASNSGYRGAASNSGYRGAASNSGYRGAASNSGEHGIAADFNGRGRVKSSATGAIFLTRREAGTGAILHVFASKVGENGIKPDIWYELGEDGKPAEV